MLDVSIGMLVGGAPTTRRSHRTQAQASASRGGFIAQQRNVILVARTGQAYIWPSPWREAESAGSGERFFTTVDLVNQLKAEVEPAARTARR
jgi:hypothetical protein